jgi:hypothetical protein
VEFRARSVLISLGRSRVTGKPHLTRRWPFGRATEGLPTIRPVTGSGVHSYPTTYDIFARHRAHSQLRLGTSAPVSRNDCQVKASSIADSLLDTQRAATALEIRRPLNLLLQLFPARGSWPWRIGRAYAVACVSIARRGHKMSRRGRAAKRLSKLLLFIQLDSEARSPVNAHAARPKSSPIWRNPTKSPC